MHHGFRVFPAVFAAALAVVLHAAGCGGAGSSDPVPCSPTAEVCDGVDNDCDPATPDGAADPQAGTACDGPDSDLCVEGSWSCVSGTMECSDTTGGTLDVCDGENNDCDPDSLDGADDPQAGTACDGPDSDLCMEGTWSCGGGALACSDTTGSTLDLCGGGDDDCDPATPDGAEDPLNGAPCAEGDLVCSGADLVCAAPPGPGVEVCDGVDNDGDDLVDEDFPALGGACSLGLGACETTGMLICSATGTTSVCDAVPGAPTAEVDDEVDNDCDGSVDEEEGFSRCHDGLDNDGDAQTDCGDWGCAASCLENTDALCHDGMDNDQSQGTDCADPDCSAFCSEATFDECHDGKDNDQDGQTDCSDEGCALVCP